MERHEDTTQQLARPRPWVSTATPVQGADDKKLVDQAVFAALADVARVRAHIPTWQHSLATAANAAATHPPQWSKLSQQLDYGRAGPGQAADELLARDKASTDAPEVELHLLSVQSLLGEHGELLLNALGEAERWWQNAKKAVTGQLPDVADEIKEAQQALGAAMQHALFLTFLGDLKKAHVGERRLFADYCQGWGLTGTQVDQLWLWLTQDRLELGGVELEIALDTSNRYAYRNADLVEVRAFLAGAILWGAAIVFGVAALFFALLHSAGAANWPPSWGWKMLVLLICVVIGAFVHIGSRILNVNYDNPIKVYDAGGIVDWLSLRWLGVLQMYVPVGFVVISLWGAHNYPTAFQEIGTAILAGYTADSLLGAAVSKLQSQAASKKNSSAAAAASTGAAAATSQSPAS